MLITGRDLLGGARPNAPFGDGFAAEHLASGDFLREAQLVEVHHDPVAQRLCVVLDLRGALDFPRDDVAVIAFDHVRDYAWSGRGTGRGAAVWIAGGSRFQRSADGHWWETVIDFGQRLIVGSQSVEIVAGQSGLLDAAPPDMCEAGHDEIHEGFPRMDTPFSATIYYVLQA